MPVVTHTLTRTVTMNGTVEYPTTVEPAEASGRQGVNLEADNGALTVVVTGTKRRWVIGWDSPLPAVVDRMRALYATGSFTFVDPAGTSYTVRVPIGGLRWGQKHDPGTSTASGTTYPSMTIEVWEA